MIHSTAIIDPRATLHPSVSVGPYSIIGPDVVVGAGTIIESHVVIKGPTTIGARNHIFQFSSIGEATPDLKYHGEPYDAYDW
jgi:UDP-N-acetylglucosamine acyltransferase